MIVTNKEITGGCHVLHFDELTTDLIALRKRSANSIKRLNNDATRKCPEVFLRNNWHAVTANNELSKKRTLSLFTSVPPRLLSEQTTCNSAEFSISVARRECARILEHKLPVTFKDSGSFFIAKFKGHINMAVSYAVNGDFFSSASSV